VPTFTRWLAACTRLPGSLAATENGHVTSAWVIQVRRGRDGKDYPATMPPPPAWRYEAIRLTHWLHCEIGLSERATASALLEYGYKRSKTSVHNDLERAMPTCPVCRAADDD
jgi:hypothetical protein